jgi:hypothetical protein
MRLTVFVVVLAAIVIACGVITWQAQKRAKYEPVDRALVFADRLLIAIQDSYRVYHQRTGTQPSSWADIADLRIPHTGGGTTAVRDVVTVGSDDLSEVRLYPKAASGSDVLAAVVLRDGRIRVLYGDGQIGGATRMPRYEEGLSWRVE